MAKFNLKAEKLKAQLLSIIKTGTYRVRIIHAIAVGDIAFDDSSAPKPHTGISFQLTTGEIVPKLYVNSFYPGSNMRNLLDAIEDVDDLEELAGKTLLLDIEENGQFPKITGYSSIEYFEGDSLEFPVTDIIVLIPEDGEPVNVKENLATIRKLPKTLSGPLLRATGKKGG